MTDGLLYTLADEPTDALITLWTQGDRRIRFGNLVTIYVDSARIEYHKGYSPEAAAKTFWEAVAHNFPCREGE